MLSRLSVLAVLLAGVSLAVDGLTQAPNLVAHWRLDDVPGSPAMDSTCNLLDGSYNAGTLVGQPGAAPGTGSSVEFDHLAMGSVDITDGPPLTTLTSDLSVTAWIYPESVGTGRMRILANNDSSWSCGIYTGGLIFTTRFVMDYFQPATIPLGVWSHVAFTFDAAFDVTCYVNGVAIGTIAGAAPAQAPSATWFLGHLNAIEEYWDGRLDDVQVYAGSLSAAEVLTLYSNPGSTLNSPTCAAPAPPAGAMLEGDITVTFDGDDPQSAAVTTVFLHSTDGGALWSTCTPAAASPTANPDPMRAVPFAGISFLWDSVADGVGAAAPQQTIVRVAVDDGCYVTICDTASFEVDNSSLCGGTCGDCDQQGGATIGVLDALVAAQIAAGLITPSLAQSGCCDVDSSGGITVLDALFIAQEAAGLGVTLVCP